MGIGVVKHLLWGLAALALGAGLAAAQPAPAEVGTPARVTTEGGVLVGAAFEVSRVFKAIPYAAPPVGPLRWRPPSPAQLWRGERLAVADGPACPQPLRDNGRPNPGGYVGPVSEDCLTLNVTAPAHAAKAPVIVWLFGGANVYGSDSLGIYDGTSFARDGVVLVTLNYRLGALGFFAHPSLTAEAGRDAPLVSYGLMDQIAALQWVRRNIAAFGGDPANVTLMGESAGGEDALHLMGIDQARGLFAKAIVESGLGWGEHVTLADRETEGAAFATKLGLAGASATAAELRALPVGAIVAAQSGEWGAAVDGRLIKQRTAQAFFRGDEAHVPLIIGSNSFEASLLVSYGANPLRVLDNVSSQLRAVYAGEAADDKALAYAVYTDRAMAAPARWLAAKASAHAPAFLYQFSYVPEARRAVQVGANHAAEIPYVFDSLDHAPGRPEGFTDADRAVARLMHACWVSFAKTGAPTCAAGGDVWPAYSPAQDELMEFGVSSGVRQHFRKRELDAVEASEKALADR